MAVESKDNVTELRYALSDPFDYYTQSLDKAIVDDYVWHKNLCNMTNVFAICEETWDAFMYLAINIQRFLKEDKPLYPASFYIKLSRIVLRTVHTVSITIVGRESRLPNGDLVCDKGKFEEWLDLPQFSDTDKLKRLYCWLVGYLENPREYETLFTKRY